MPDPTVEFNNRLTPEQMVQTQRDAEQINQKHKAEGKKYGQNLGKDSFLKLLVTELTHQDPTKPMEDKEFIAQMAQFSSLEQMNNVNDQMKQLNQGNQTSEAYSLIGKEIESLDAQNGSPIRGTVSHVIRGENEIFLAVGKHKVRLNDVHAVFQGSPAPAQTTPSQKAPSGPAEKEQMHKEQVHRETAAVPSYSREEGGETESQESTEKGMRNSFNKFNSNYDNSTTQYKKAQSAYTSQ